MTKKILLAYYSMSGKTRMVADELAATIDADCEAIREPHPRHGTSGLVRALFDAMTRRDATIEPPRRDPASYDLLILGGPIWAGRLASPVRTYALQMATRMKKVAFLCTQGGRGAEHAFAELEKLCACPPSATLIVNAEQMKTSSYQDALGEFGRKLQMVIAAREPVQEHGR